MIREKKTFLILILSMLAMVVSSQVLDVHSGDVVALTGEDWSTYEPISDTNLNSSYFEILTDSANNIHVMFCARDKIANYSLLVHEIIFNNGSKKTVNILDVDGQSAYDDFVVDIDNLDNIHLIQRNSSGNNFVYYVGYQGTWELKNTFEEDTYEFNLVVDSSQRVRFIYSGHPDNLYDKIFYNNEWHEGVQITFYEPEPGIAYFSTYFTKIAKSKQGKIALLYGFKSHSETPGVMDTTQLDCLVFDGHWLEPKIITDYYPLANDLAFDDVEKLHLIWTSLEGSNVIDYQTLKGNRWSKVKQSTLHEKVESGLGYYGIYTLDLEIKGATILIALSVSELLEIAFDQDLFVAYSNDGKTYTTVPVYRNDETRSIAPQIAATTDGDVCVVAYENPIFGGYNRTINMGYYESLFVYQTTAIPIEYLAFIFPVAIAVLVFKKKTR